MQPEDTKMQPEEPDGLPQKKVKILVVEDVVNLATVLQSRLESYGYEICDVAGTGPKAIDKAVQHRPDLILMDIMLEGEMNGIEAAGHIQSKLDVPIIYLSCLNDEKVIDQAIETNPYGYILKPYDGAELRFGIENALKMHRVHRQHTAQSAATDKPGAEPQS